MSSLSMLIESDKRERRPPARTDTMDSLTRMQMRDASSGGRSPRRRAGTKPKKKMADLDQFVADINASLSASSDQEEEGCSATVDSRDLVVNVRKPVRRAGRRPKPTKEEPSDNSE